MKNIIYGLLVVVILLLSYIIFMDTNTNDIAQHKSSIFRAKVPNDLTGDIHSIILRLNEIEQSLSNVNKTQLESDLKYKNLLLKISNLSNDTTVKIDSNIIEDHQIENISIQSLDYELESNIDSSFTDSFEDDFKYKLEENNIKAILEDITCGDRYCKLVFDNSIENRLDISELSKNVSKLFGWDNLQMEFNYDEDDEVSVYVSRKNETLPSFDVSVDDISLPPFIK